jgi:hypothetical protein
MKYLPLFVAIILDFVQFCLGIVLLPLGIMGGVIDTALSITIGSALLMLLAFEGMFYPSIAIKGFLGETIPLINYLPCWTFVVLKSMSEKKKREAGTGATTGVFGMVGGMAAGMIPGGAMAKTAVSLAQRQVANPVEVQTPQEEMPSKSRAAVLPARFNDIRAPRAANDNEPRKAYAA